MIQLPRELQLPARYCIGSCSCPFIPALQSAALSTLSHPVASIHPRSSCNFHFLLPFPSNQLPAYHLSIFFAFPLASSRLAPQEVRGASYLPPSPARACPVHSLPFRCSRLPPSSLPLLELVTPFGAAGRGHCSLFCSIRPFHRLSI